VFAVMSGGSAVSRCFSRVSGGLRGTVRSFRSVLSRSGSRFLSVLLQEIQ
jgi:hypothetical protein